MDQQWADILEMPVPMESFLSGWLLVLITLIIGLALTAIAWKTRPAQRTASKIRALNNKLDKNSDNRLLLHKLYKILCARYSVSQLSHYKVKNPDWQDFIEKLSLASYQPGNPDNVLTHQLLQEAIHYVNLRAP